MMGQVGVGPDETERKSKMGRLRRIHAVFTDRRLPLPEPRILAQELDVSEQTVAGWLEDFRTA